MKNDGGLSTLFSDKSKNITRVIKLQKARNYVLKTEPDSSLANRTSPQTHKNSLKKI